jgi:hypothetical protein
VALQSLSSSNQRPPKLALGKTPRGTHSFWTPYRQGAGETNHGDGKTNTTTTKHNAPTIVFGMQVAKMLRPSVNEASADSEARATQNKVGNNYALTSPMGSLHSC